MNEKTFHIGEYCLHGTVKIEWFEDARIVIRLLTYKTSEIMESAMFDFVDKFKIRMHLEDRMSSYYADKIMDTIYA